MLFILFDSGIVADFWRQNVIDTFLKKYCHLAGWYGMENL